MDATVVVCIFSAPVMDSKSILDISADQQRLCEFSCIVKQEGCVCVDAFYETTLPTSGLALKQPFHTLCFLLLNIFHFHVSHFITHCVLQFTVSYCILFVFS